MLVYKYRKANKQTFDRDLKAIEKNQFWASSLEDLNDPCEGITVNSQIKNILSFIGNRIGLKSRDDFKLVEDNVDEVLSFNKMGIYSLSKTPLDELLWAHYSDGHKGFCIEYDIEVLLKSDGENNIHSFPVVYSKNPPSIKFWDLFQRKKDNLTQKLAFYKSKKWEHEKEHRIITSKIGSNSYDYRALKSIYFGLKISEEYRNLIIDKLKGRGIKFYQIELKENSYSFGAIRLDEISQEISYLNDLHVSKLIGDKINIEIVRIKIFNYSGIGEFEIILEKKVNDNELKRLTTYLKENLFENGKSIFFNFYINNSQIENVLWKTATISNGKIEIR